MGVGIPIRLPFALQTNFIDPVYDANGLPWALKRYDEIIKEKYEISKYGKIPYDIIDGMSFTERSTIAKVILNDLKREKELLEQKLNKTTKKLY